MSTPEMQSDETQTNSSTSPRHRRGFALESVLMLMVMFSVIILAGLSAVTSLSRTSNADYRASRATYASEGGADDIMSQLDAAMQDGIISNQDISTLLTPSLPGYRFVQTTRTVGSPVTKTITTGPFSGLYSLNQPIDIQVTARDSSGNKATSILSVNAQTIPLFQFGVFYEGDLEIEPGAPMTFAGWVHTNGNLYLSSASVTFQSQITTPDSVFWQRKDQNQRLSGVRINNAAGSAVQLDFDSRSLAGAAFVNRSQSKFNGRLMTEAHGVRPLKLPLPGGTPPIALVQPRDPNDTPMAQDVKMAWKADWIITVNSHVFRMDTNTLRTSTSFCDSLIQVRVAGMVAPTGIPCRKIFKAKVNAFYDGREDLKPDLLDIHMDSLRLWTDALPGQRAPRIIYIEFVNDSAGLVGSGGQTGVNDYMAVRLRGGARLPVPTSSADTGGVSIVTNRPMYVLGDYNTTVWRPAALMADAITFLSNPATAAMTGCVSATTGWCDMMQASGTQRIPRATTVNAAILAGHSPTSCDWQRAGCGTPVYGGGLENFPRFLENWAGITFTYTGSLVSLFANQYSHGLWGNTTNGGAYYSAPTRAWQFDINFRFPQRLPPGTPSVGTVLQTAYRPIY
ncbi:MAG: hypothetical protein ABI852_01755 [Gemmatimonadaceae bacterium]